MANLVEKSENTNFYSKNITKDTAHCVEIVTSSAERIPTYLALAEAQAKNYSDAFSLKLYQIAMREIWEYYRDRAKFPSEKIVFKFNEIRVGTNNIYFSNLSEDEQNEYIRDIHSRGVVVANIGHNLTVSLNLLSIFLIDRNNNTVSVYKDNIVEKIDNIIKSKNLSIEQEKKLETQYVNVFNDYDGYSIPQLKFSPSGSVKKTRGFYHIKLLLLVFRSSVEGFFNINFNELKISFGQKEKEDKYFNRDILTPAMLSINEVLPWLQLKVEKHVSLRDKRKVESLTFYFLPFKVRKNDPKKLIDIDESKSIDKFEVFENLSKNQFYLYSPKHEQESVNKGDAEHLLHAKYELLFKNVKQKMNFGLFENERFKDFEFTALDMEQLFKTIPVEVIRKNYYIFLKHYQYNTIGNIFNINIRHPKSYIMSILLSTEGFFTLKKNLVIENIPNAEAYIQKEHEILTTEAKKLNHELGLMLFNELAKIRKNYTDLDKYAQDYTQIIESITDFSKFTFSDFTVKIETSMELFFFITQVFKENNISETIFAFMGDQIKLLISIKGQPNVKVEYISKSNKLQENLN